MSLQIDKRSYKGVIIPRHDTARNWSKAENFVPKQGELIVYDADTDTYDTTVTIGGVVCEIKSSTITRFKFGNGTSNVNVLPFVTTEGTGSGSGGAVNLDGYATEEWVLDQIGDTIGVTEEWVKDYVEDNSEVVLLVDSQERIGMGVEIPNAHLIQDNNDTMLKIISKNMLNIPSGKYDLGNQTNGVSFQYSSSGGYIEVSKYGTGSIFDNRECYIHGRTRDASLGMDVNTNGIKIPVGGKYTVSVEDVSTSASTGNISVNVFGSLYDCTSSTPRLVLRKELVVGHGGACEWTVDSRELHFDTIVMGISYTSGNSMTTRRYKIQVEPGEQSTSYTHFMSDLSGIEIVSNNRNLFDSTQISGDIPVKVGDKVTFGNSSSVEITSPGVYYLNGIASGMESGEILEVRNSQGLSQHVTNYVTPFTYGDPYTFSFVVNSTNGVMTNVQLLYGHLKSSSYVEPLVEESITRADGSIDTSIIHSPYSFVHMKDPSTSYAICARFNPAVTSDWIESQMKSKVTPIVSAFQDGTIELEYDTEHEKLDIRSIKLEGGI